MAEASQTPATVSTPSSSAPTTTQNGSVTTKASKDRACPFCNQPFTSSSLGRHLDLYIKPKNPKPPDGIHDVDKIRAMRGGITRRQPRVSLKGRSETEAGSDRGTPMSGTPNGQWGRRLTIGSQDAAGGAAAAAAAAMIGRDMTSPVNMRDDNRWKLNAANWQATGVINNLPPRISDGTTPSTKYTSRYAPSMAQLQGMALRKDGGENIDQEVWARLNEERDAGKAADLALRDVLGSLEAARSRAMQTRLFDFDFYSMNFPSLCLHILPAPPALFSMTPFASSDSWPLNAPGRTQLDTVKRQVAARVDQRRATLSDLEVQKIQMHLQDAWNHWCQLPEKEKSATWQVEVLRAYARAGQIAQEKEAQLQKANQDLEHLREQYDQLCRHQLPRELILHTPSTLPVNSASLLEALSSRDTQDRVWDYDRLIDRWRGVVKATKGTSRAQDDHTSTPAQATDKNLAVAPHLTPSTSFDVRNTRAQTANGHQQDQSVARRATNDSAQDDEELSDADADADADADDDDDMDADGEEAPESSTSAAHMQDPSRSWGNTSHQRGMSDAQQQAAAAAMVNSNGKRPQPPQVYAQEAGRPKGLKMYHQGPLPGDGDVFGRAIGQV